MVNPDSPAFKISEKVGLIIGKGIRYLIVGGVIVFLGGKLGGSKPSHPVPNPGPSPSPSSSPSPSPSP